MDTLPAFIIFILHLGSQMNTTYGVPHTMQEKCWALEHILGTTVGTWVKFSGSQIPLQTWHSVWLRFQSFSRTWAGVLSCPEPCFRRIWADLWFWVETMWDLAVPHGVYLKPGKKLAVSTKFHFDSKAMGLSVPLFPAQLNLLRVSHKAKRLSHKTSFLRTARLGL